MGSPANTTQQLTLPFDVGGWDDKPAATLPADAGGWDAAPDQSDQFSTPGPTRPAQTPAQKRTISLGGPKPGDVAAFAKENAALADFNAPILPVSKLAPEKPTSIAGGIAKGVASVAEGLTTPTNLALFGTGPILGVASKVLPFLPRAVSAYLTFSMAKDAIEKSPEVTKAIADGDYPKAAEKLTEMTAAGYFARKAGEHALGGPSLADWLDQHNAEAAQAVEDERNNTTPVDGEPTPVANVPGVAVRASAVSPTGTVFHDVIDPETGEVLFNGTSVQVQDYISKRATPPIQAGAEPESKPEAPAATLPPDAGGWDAKPPTTTALDPGHSADLPSGKYTVNKVEDGKVQFTQEKPDGTTVKSSLPENTYRRMVAGATAKAPAEPLREEVVQPQTTPAEVEQAGAAQGVQGATNSGVGSQQPAEVPAVAGVGPQPGAVPIGQGQSPVSGLPLPGTSPSGANQPEPIAGDTGATPGPVRRVTGSTPINLSPEGHVQASEMAKPVEDGGVIAKPFDSVVASPASRAVETASYFSPPDDQGNPTAAIDPALAPKSSGALEGQPAETAKEQIRDLLANPEKVAPGISTTSGQPGDSQANFERRLFAGYKELEGSVGPEDRALAITSGGNLQAIDALLKAGGDPARIDHAELSKQPYWSDTGQLFKATPEGLEKVADNSDPGLYLTEHASTAFNPPKSEQSKILPGRTPKTANVKPKAAQPTPEAKPREPLPIDARLKVTEGTAKDLLGASVSIETRRETAQPMLDTKKKPTGWGRIDLSDGVALVHPTEDTVIRFETKDRRKGSDVVRAKAQAQAYAMDNRATSTVLPPATEKEAEVIPTEAETREAQSLLPSEEKRGSWMNRFDIEEASDKHKNDKGALGKAVKFLHDFMEEVDAHSDGWPYWRLPAHAALKLETLIQNPETATEDKLRAALSPIRAFYTRHGSAAGMKFPEINLVSSEKKPATPQIPSLGGGKYVLPSFVGKPTGTANAQPKAQELAPEAKEGKAKPEPLAKAEQTPTLKAEEHGTEPVRPENSQSLEGKLPEGSGSPGEAGATPAGSGKSGRVRKPRQRAGASEGPELEPSGGTVSGVVGDAAKPEQTFPPRAQDVVSTHHDRDYRIPNGRVVSGSPEARARINIDAIKLLKEIQEQNRPATVEEQKILAGYVGWGAVPQLFAGIQPEFRELQKELRGYLTDDEYADAQRSTTNAHYTGDLVVDSMWKAMQHIGAKPGMSWLEPAVGVGNFFGRQPQELLEGARRIGLDKDSVSGQIAKLLYPDSGIDVKAFEEAELPKDYFDGAISNVPFGNFGVHDPEFRGKQFLTGSIHNYFFAKALTLVRPGGVVGFVTSRYTMDAYAPAAVNFRNWVGEQAHLIGAVRLPSGAFRQNAGTDVITDVIFLRKKLPGEGALGGKFSKSIAKNVKTQWGGMVPLAVNEYFHEHPEMILGEEGTNRGQFSANDYDVKGNATAEQIQSAVEKFAKVGFEDWKPGERKQTVATRDIKTSEGSKLGGLFFDEKGNLFRRTSKGAAEPMEVSRPAKARIKGQLAVRDALSRLLDAELTDKPEGLLTQLRKHLNAAYDGYVNKNGPLSSQANTAVMKGDPDAPLLVSLERRFQKGNKAKGVEPSSEKAPIFSRRVLRPAEVPTSVGEPKDALYISLNEKGRLDFQRMGELTGRTPEQLQQDLKGLIYQDPQTKIWQTAEEYLSGSVRNKLKQAQAIAKLEPKYKENAEALEKVQPEDIPPGQIRALMGVTWVPLDTYSQFATELLGTNRPVQVKYVGGNWFVDAGYGNPSNSKQWSTARVGAVELLNDSLNMRRTKVMDRDSDGSTSVNPDETKSARAKQMEMQDHFEKWLFEDTKRGDQLVRLYNDTQNDLRLRTYDGAHLTLPGMARDAAVVRGGDLDPHQKAAVWRQIVQPNVLLAHSVGSGKTFEAIAGGMELKRLGLIRRPMYVVPNATLTSWQDQFSALYPQARVLAFSEKDLEKENRKRVMAQIATGDWDAVVVPHSSFQFLSTGDEIFEQHYDKLAGELEEQIREAQEAGMDTRMIKRMEKAKERLLTSLKDKRKADTKDQTVTWEQLGIDHLVVDESHEYKKLGFATKQGNVAGIDQNGNQKTFDLLMKLRYTQTHGRGAVFMSGTPVTNTMGELYSIMKYLIEPELEARGIGKFDEWAANFGRTVDVFEPKIEGGGYQMKARFAQFVNLPELAQLFRSFADVVTSDMIDIPRPAIAGGKRIGIEQQLTDEQEDYLASLRQRAEGIRRDPRNSLPDNMLAVYGDAAKMAMDIRMVRPGAPDDPHGRLNAAAQRIKELYDASDSVKGTQLVMSDLGKPADAGGSKDFSAYDELISKLVEQGVPRNEIATIYQAKNKAQRAKIFQDVNDGKIRVLLGSTQKMGVGVNVQKRLYAMHHLDVPHRPSDLEQREGRILRQGNENPEVHIHYYVTRGSLDEAKFANVVRKAKFINQVMQGKSEVREAEDVGGMVPSLEMFQAMASGDPRVMKKMETDAEVDRLSGVFAGWKNQQYKIRTEMQQVPWRITNLENAVKSIQRDMAIRDKAGDAWTIGNKKFSGEKIGKDVSEALRKEVAKAVNKNGEDVNVGTAFGLPLSVTVKGRADLANHWVTIDIGDIAKATVDVSDIPTADMYRRVRNQVESFEEDVAAKQTGIVKAKKEEENLKASIQERWPYAEKFKELVETQQRLVKELGGDKGDDAALAVGEGGEIADKSVEAAEPESDEEEPEEDEEDEKPKSSGGVILGSGLGSLQEAYERAVAKGARPIDFLSLGTAKFIEKDVLPTLANAVRTVGASRGDILKVIAPAAREGAEDTALTIRERAADLARSTDRAAAALEVAHKFFDKQPADENLDFIDRIENGQKQPDGNGQVIADTMRQILDDRRNKVQDLGTGKLEEFYEDYFPHIWKDPKEAEVSFKSWFAKRPMEGAKSFLKKRTIPTIKDGIEMGLKPESTNPVDLILAKVREMDKYIFAHRALDDLKHQGVLKFNRAMEKMPDGYAKINDKIAQVYEGKTAQGSLAKRGEWVAPEPAATIINNYLSPGLRQYAGFRAYMGIANVLNQFQLGWSAYHFGFTSFDAAVSRVALGIMQAANGKPLKGLATAATAPVAPFTGIAKGDKLLREWYKPGTQGAEIGDLVDAMMMAGGRARMDSFYQTQITKNMMAALRQGNIWGAALRAPFALTEQAARPIMEYIVPRQKMAVFADLAKEELAKFDKDRDPAKLRAALAKAWDSVDNRMGQLVYDNLFWNKAVKDLAMASVRSVGWNVGTIREIIGGGADTVKAAGDAIKGKSPEFTSRMAYIIALPIVAGLAGGILHYLNTHETPEELKDWFFPRRGPKGTPGWNKREVLPSYVKDIEHWRHDPIGTMKGKIHPLLELIVEMLSNEDYFGKHIRNSKDPLVKQMEDMAKQVGETIEPIAVRPMLEKNKKGDETTAEKVLPFVGITEAPRYIKEDGEEPERRRSQ